GDIECDPVSFARFPEIQNKDAIWVKDRFSDQIFGVEAPFGACAPVPTPSLAGCPTGDLDTDGDGFPDCWEDKQYWSDNRPGIAVDGVYTAGRDPGGSPPARIFTLCVPPSSTNPNDCANPLKRDIFVEIDYMQFHQPN